MVLPVVLLVLTHFVIASINQHYYGVRVVNDLKSPEFVAALGGLMNIDEDEFRQRVIIGPRSQKKAFEVSPSFRELEPFLSAKSSVPNFFYIWSIRSAVRQAGYYQPHDAARTQDLYARIGAELRAACDAGKLKCLDRKPTLRPPVRKQHLDLGISTFLDLARDAIGFRYHNSSSAKFLSKADNGVLLTVDYVTGEDAFRKSAHLAYQPDFHRKRVAMKEYLMGRIAQIYRYLVPLLFIVAMFLHLRQLALGLLNRPLEFKPLFGLVLGGSILSILIVLTFVKSTLWGIARPLHVVYPIILLYIALMLIPDKSRQSGNTD
jgi:hypothetical protein